MEEYIDKEFYIMRDEMKYHAKLSYPRTQKEKFPLAILCHGLTGHMEEDHIVAIDKMLVENGFASLRVEMYGHGMSGGSFSNHTLLDWIAGLLYVIDYAEKLPFVNNLYLIGHSQGGANIVYVSAMRQKNLKAIIPLAPAVAITDYCRNGNFLGAIFDPENLPEYIPFQDKLLSGNYIRVGQNIDFFSAASRFHKPVLLIHSDTDELVPVQYSYRLAETYPDAEFKIIQGDDHCFTGHIDQVTEIMREFLERQEKMTAGEENSEY